MRYKVILLPEALADIEEIYEWLHERSSEGANAWHDACMQAVDALEQSPEVFGRAPEGRDREESIRQKFFRTRRGRLYRMIYVVREYVVYVLRVRGPGQALMNDPDLQLPPEPDKDDW